VAPTTLASWLQATSLHICLERSRVRIWITSELDRFSGSLFRISVGRLGTCRLGNKTEVGRAGVVLICTPQIRRDRLEARYTNDR
jgi:hypothetical protein